MNIILDAKTSPSIRCPVLAMVCLLGSCGSLLAQQPPAPAPAAKPSRAASALRNDPALQVQMTVDFKRPKAQEILERLRDATKMDFTLAEDINQEYPALGSLSCRNVPAWVIMEELAKSKRIEGRWHKDGAGYRLVGNGKPAVIAEKPKERTSEPSVGLRLLLVAVPLILALSLAYWWIKRREQRTAVRARLEGDKELNRS